MSEIPAKIAMMEEEGMKKEERKRVFRYWKRAAACALALVFLLSACGGTAKSSADGEAAYMEQPSYKAAGSSYDYAAEESIEAGEAAYDLDEGMEAPLASMSAENSAVTGSGDGDRGGSGDGTEAADLESSNRKIIYTGNVSLQTLEYDKSSKSIHDKINKYGGFIENEDTYNEDPYWYYKDRTGAAANRTRRNLSLTARIPAEKFDAFMKDLEKDGQVTNTSVSARNISVEYATHDASRKALEIEQKRLLEMMDKAETIEDMIAVEQRLTEVERELNDEKTQLTGMDRDVNFSTIYINLQEVFEYSEKVVEVTYGERLKRAFDRAISGFVEFWKDLILAVVESFPFLIMLAVVIFLIVKLVRRGHRRRAEKRAEKLARMQQAQGMPGAAGMPQAAGMPGVPGAQQAQGMQNTGGGQQPARTDLPDQAGQDRGPDNDLDGKENKDKKENIDRKM